MSAINGMATFDAFMNTMARTGFGQPNHMEGTSYPMTRFTQNYAMMNSLYRGSWITRRIIDIIPKDMLKNGWKYLCDINPDEINLLQRAQRLTRLNKSLLKGLNWGRLYGGAAGLLMIDGQEDELDQPLNLDAVELGDFRGLLIMDRWSGVYPDMGLVTDISSPDFGTPEYYQLGDKSQMDLQRVHHTRIVRFEGDDLPEWERLAENYWGASKMESVLEELKKRDNTSANIAGLIFLANLRILKMEDLGQMLSGTNAKVQANLFNTIQSQNWLQSNFGMYVMSKDDEFQSIRTSFSDLDDIYECFMMDIAGAAQIPVTKLFGRSPAGMNATGESDLQNYYDVIDQEQHAHLTPILDKILPVMFKSTMGYIPDDLDYMYNPVRTPNDKELGEQVKWKTEAIFGAHDRAIISDRVALKELRQLSDDTGLFSNITDDDINAASDKPSTPIPPMEEEIETEPTETEP
jgi:phage-related protein (TIGR01555 family)